MDNGKQGWTPRNPPPPSEGLDKEGQNITCMRASYPDPSLSKILYIHP